MNDARWERVQQLVEGALDLPTERRRAFVESACAGDPELRDEVLSLLEVEAVEELPSEWLGTLAEPEADRFAPGDRVAGRYLVRSLIGRGGMGEVYEAEDEDLGIVVALKTLRDVGNDAVTLERLKLEGMLARAVWHPNVCRVYELGRHGEEAPLWFLAMERLHGPTLQERLREQGRLPLERALRVAEEIGAGLSAAHRAGVVHRDLKPGNILLVTRDGREHAVITDFGTSRALPRSEPGAPERRAGLVVGTPGYMAPEQLCGEEVGPAADIYAFGVVLFEMRSGSLPGTDDGGAELDARWADVIGRCLEHDPRRRFARAEDVADALAGRSPRTAAGLADTGAERTSSLPAERDAFVGREDELRQLERAREAGDRVLTLVGPGGMGKTRLAIRFGGRTAGTWPGGIWFCDLTEAKDTDGIASAVGVTFGVQLGRGDIIGQLGNVIAGRGACLVVLDNFEQVVAHAEETIGRWRSIAPEATFLVTSRERLAIEGERTRAVEPLSDEAALELLTVRARGLRPGLELGDADHAAAREIVRLLDGIPLAIELAAARIRVMSLAQILEGTRKRFQLLAGGSGARHETLEVAIAGSWELLAPWEQAAWAQCAVFEGGFTLEAAGAVLDLSAWPDAPPIVDVMWSLVDKSLLRTWVPAMSPGESVPDVRFGMYVTLQEYARARLRSLAGAERPAEERHGAHYAALGKEEVLAASATPDGSGARRRLERELENVVAACRRAIERGDGPTVAAAYGGAWRVLTSRGPLGTALTLGALALEDARLSGAERAIVSGTLSEAEWYAGRYENARAHGETAVAIARERADARLEARFAAALGRAEFVLSRADEARAAFEAAATAARSVGDRQALASALNGLGMLHHELGHIDEARSSYAEGIALTRAIGDRRLESIIRNSLGILEHKAGNLDGAAALFEGALAIHHEMGNRRSEGTVHVNLGSLRTDQGRIAEAREHTEAALAIAREIGSRSSEGVALAALGEMAVEAKEWEEARRNFVASLAIHRELGDRRVEGIILHNLAHLDDLQGEIDAADAGYEQALAIHREIGDRHYEGAALVSVAGILIARGRLADARARIAEGESMLRELGARQELARALCVRTELECAFGDAAAARAALDEAESIAVAFGARTVSELDRALARARAAVAGTGDVKAPVR